MYQAKFLEGVCVTSAYFSCGTSCAPTLLQKTLPTAMQFFRDRHSYIGSLQKYQQHNFFTAAYRALLFSYNECKVTLFNCSRAWFLSHFFFYITQIQKKKEIWECKTAECVGNEPFLLILLETAKWHSMETESLLEINCSLFLKWRFHLILVCSF